jgi:ribosome-associated protein
MQDSDLNSGPGRSVTPADQAAEARAFALAAARIAHDNKATDVRVLDLRELSNLADFFVLATGTSNRQMHAVLEHVHDHAREIGRKRLHISDPTDASWMLADYVDVVVHLFDEDHRAYYDLDGLWGDAAVVPWRSPDEADDED